MTTSPAPSAETRQPTTPVLRLHDLTVDATAADGKNVRLVNGVTFSLGRGERLALVGESGSGKSVTARAVLRLDPSLRIGGRIDVNGRDITALSNKEMTSVRGREVAMVFQNPMGALNPLMTIGAQVSEPLRRQGLNRAQATERACDLLDELGVPNARRRLRAYPHEFSGGMRQRVVMAMALARNPDVLLADEPTTALDVRAQEQVLATLDQAARERNLSVLLITHDLGIVAGFADRVVVMYSGQVVHTDPVDDIFAHPAHPYTRGLLQALPRVDKVADRLIGIKGSPPHPAYRPAGCPFHPRCRDALEHCKTLEPELVPLPSGGDVSCHLFTRTEGRS